jgi:uncharacterized protein YwqG
MRSEILEQLQPWRDAHKRLTWKPIVKDGDGSITASKFSGQPWLDEQESYPICGCCQTPMALLLQLNLNEIPPELANQFGTGLLQLFYCLNCSSYAPFEDNKLVRIVEPNQYPSQPPVIGGLGGVKDKLPAKTIIGWKQLEDYPDGVELEEWGLIFNDDYTEELIRIECPDFGIIIDIPDDSEIEDDLFSMVVTGDKLSGYPDWVQDVEYPNCPECQRRMQFVFQIDSNDNLPIMFGDMGCGHITQCPEHKHILTFSWACY